MKNLCAETSPQAYFPESDQETDNNLLTFSQFLPMTFPDKESLSLRTHTHTPEKRSEGRGLVDVTIKPASTIRDKQRQTLVKAVKRYFIQ